MERKNPFTAEKMTAETTPTTMYMMNSFMIRQQAQHKAALKFALRVVDDA